MSIDQAVEYREIPGFPGYRAGSDGTIWTCRVRIRPMGQRRGFVAALSGDWKQMTPETGKKTGYLKLRLYRDGKKSRRNVHQLVALAFFGPRPDGLECRHLNGNGSDCRVENLKYGTPGQNTEDRRRHGTLPLGEAHSAAILTEADVRSIRARYANGELASAMAKEYGVHIQCVWAIVYRRTWRHVA
jgi:hypothetical protein